MMVDKKALAPKSPSLIRQSRLSVPGFDATCLSLTHSLGGLET